MEYFQDAFKIIQPNYWMASADLKDGFYSVPMHGGHQKYLKCQWLEKNYKFLWMSNGYSEEMRIFPKILKPHFFLMSRIYKVQQNIACINNSPQWNPPWRGEGPYLTRGFYPSASRSWAHLSNAAMSDKDKQICFMLMPKTWFNMREFRVASLSLVSFGFCRWADLHPISIYIIFSCARVISYGFLSSSCGLKLSSLEVKYDRFRNRYKGTWQKPLEILTTKDRWFEHLKYVKDVLQSEEASRRKSMNTRAHNYNMGVTISDNWKFCIKKSLDFSWTYSWKWKLHSWFYLQVI